MEHHLLGEGALALMLIAAYSFHWEQPIFTQTLVDMIMTTIRIFDEYLLPLHLVWSPPHSPWSNFWGPFSHCTDLPFLSD
jgi:hypothetical protein